MKRVIIVGLGGIGSNLIEPLCRILAYAVDRERAPKRVILIDGKAYKERNRERQKFSALANKAEVTIDWLKPLFPELDIEARPYFIDSNNIPALIRDGDIVFLGCDNHATRNLISAHVGSLDNALLISGGNELYDGNAQIYERREGNDVTPSLIFQHPEIENPSDRNPAELSCEELAKAGEPQILAVNLTIATLMLNSFTLWLTNDLIPYHEIYFDLRTGNVRPVKQKAVI
jgi:molybdopterin/thiamine biosynthesis adenylyltransferase